MCCENCTYLHSAQLGVFHCVPMLFSAAPPPGGRRRNYLNKSRIQHRERAAGSQMGRVSKSAPLCQVLGTSV
ncbi:hypothetical protein GDO81_027853 [Engystomops pustulosus]|uniref:Uncharacterized protein n=1 Tax=Engystomops pustulosus TaxID=76066 RepID=A0AAV6YDX2_ENGPU|nr:hypothetical protein GDO81_027853 [Engystomops pustulosus]